MIDPARDPGLQALPPHAWNTVNRSALERARVLITGATGFVGRWLLTAIGRLNETLATPLHVRALTRDVALPSTDWLTWVRGDVRTFSDTTPVPFIVHAALPSIAASVEQEAELRDTALRGAEAVIRHAKQVSARRILVLSSGAVYGPQSRPVSERDVVQPVASDDAYAVAKRDVEAMFAAERVPGREVVIARLFTCIGVGYRNHAHLAHVALLDDARAGRPIALRGDGTAVRSYLFGADLAVWLLALLAATGSDTVNVGSDEAIAVRDFARVVARAGGQDERRVHVGSAADVRRPCFVPDITHARQVYGLAPWTPVAHAVALTLAAAPPA